MDWTDNLKHKRNVRKMAGRMLWADVKDVVCSWKVLLLLLIYLLLFFLPYQRTIEDLNAGCIYYFVIWILISFYALAEKTFHFLPLSTKDIVYYLVYRTNLLITWMVIISVGTGLVLQAVGVEVFLERGLAVLLFLLITLEWMFFMTLYGYSKPEGIDLMDAKIPKARKIRIIIYNIYSLSLLLIGMFFGMFMEYGEQSQKKVLFLLCAYLVMFIFRADAMRWVRFAEYTKTGNRSMFAAQEQRMNSFTSKGTVGK